MARLRMIEVGKFGEKVIRSFFEYCGFYVDRLKDSHTAGSLMSGNLGDFVVSGLNSAFYLEVKTTELDNINKGILKIGQMRKQLVALKYGTPGVYAFVMKSHNRVLIYRWEDVFVWHKIRSIKNINKHSYNNININYTLSKNYIVFKDKWKELKLELIKFIMQPSEFINQATNITFSVPRKKYSKLNPKILKRED